MVPHLLEMDWVERQITQLVQYSVIVAMIKKLEGVWQHLEGPQYSLMG